MTLIASSEKEIYPAAVNQSAQPPHDGDKTVADVKHYEEEQIEYVPDEKASNRKALFLVLKAFVGTGVIFLPGG
jgi:hypothetical protein